MATTPNSLQNHKNYQKGSKLEHFWLDGEEGKLHPAEQKLLECVAVGEICEIASERPVAATRENTIRSSFLRFLILGGDEQAHVHERGIRVKGAFVDCECSKGNLDLEGAFISHDIDLRICEIAGDILFVGAIAKTISLQGSSVAKIDGDRANLSGDLFLQNGFHAKGSVRFLNAKIVSSFDCGNSKFADSTFALVLDGAKIGGTLFLGENFGAIGVVRLLGTKIGSNLVCRDGYFGDNGQSLTASNTQIGGNLFLDDGFQARGEVDFRNAHIGGNVYCDDAIFSCKNQALVFNRATIDGMVLLGKGLMSAGQISFSSTKIGRDLSVQGVSLEGNPCLQLRNAEIRGTLTWRGIKYARGQLDLTGVSCRDFSFDEPSWQKPREIKLTNFTYKSFTELPKDADGDFWCDWLNKQPNSHQQTKFRPKPYEQLAYVLTEMGYSEEARAVRIEKQHRQTDFIRRYQSAPKRPNARLLRALNIFWRRAVLGLIIDYGYRPGKALLYLLGIGIFSSFIFWWAAWVGIMTPTHPLIYKEAHASNGAISQDCRENWVYPSKECVASLPSEHSEFQPIIYAFDVLLPVVNLRQEVDWAPRVVHVDGSTWRAGHFIRVWEWFEIIAGWVLSLLLVSAISGAIKR